MKQSLLLMMLFIYLSSAAQQQTYDLLSFIPPQGWTKQETENLVHYTITNNAKRTWARVSVVKSTASKGSMELDFAGEWNVLVAKNYGANPTPLTLDTATVNGWKMWSGTGQFVFNGDTSFVILSTFSNDIRCVSLIMVGNSTMYEEQLTAFASSINIAPYDKKTVADTYSAGGKTVLHTPGVAKKDGFTFNTTNFEDGWTSMVKEDWVEATKGNIKVLLHYPREEDKKYYSQYKEHVQVFWNLLVAPRYSNLREYQSPDHLLTWQPGLFAAGLLTDKTTGQDVWVALFSKGKSGWVEVITPDKKTFVENFGVDQPEMYFDDWDRMLKLFGLNKFAVGENDLVGTWSNQFYGSTAYYNVHTGIYAGSSSVASGVTYSFKANKTYQWNLGMTSSNLSTGSRTDVSKASGTWKVLNHWQVWCSEIERRPATYNAYFTCFKGGRLLWLQDVSYGSYTAYGKINQ